MTEVPPEQIIIQARTWLGTAYHHQGRLKKSDHGPGGVDCLGLVVGVIAELGIQDGHGNPLKDADELNYSMYPEGNRLITSISKHLESVPLEERRIGDLLLFKTFQEPQHIGLLSEYPIGGSGLIHCTSTAGKVVEQPLSATWIKMMTHVFRFSEAQLRLINV